MSQKDAPVSVHYYYKYNIWNYIISEMLSTLKMLYVKYMTLKCVCSSFCFLLSSSMLEHYLVVCDRYLESISSQSLPSYHNTVQAMIKGAESRIEVQRSPERYCIVSTWHDVRCCIVGNGTYWFLESCMNYYYTFVSAAYWFNHNNNIQWRAHIMQLVMLFILLFLASCLLIIKLLPFPIG